MCACTCFGKGRSTATSTGRLSQLSICCRGPVSARALAPFDVILADLVMPPQSMPHNRASTEDLPGDSSGRLSAEIWHRVVQDAVDCRTVLAREALLQRREPAAHRLERRTDRPRRHDPFDSDRRAWLLARKQNLLQPLAGPGADELDLDIAARLEP